ncbi:hypothetical protein [Maribacter spongiicola]|uniref:hypothetical protein n=1 Tax=Maribacter spongiicola TaxID=1206753 RepID=UPI003F9C7B57
MKKISLPKLCVGLLLLSLPFNFIAFSGLGNVYSSTLTIFSLFLLLIGVLFNRIFSKRDIILSILVFTTLLLFTIVNVVFDVGQGLKMQLIFAVIYFQSFLVFIISYYALDKVKLDYVFKLYLIVGLLLFIRMAMEEPQNIFGFSVVRGQRIEANFAGAVNNFALLIGLCVIISFFYIKNKTLKVLFSISSLFVLILTMSRGALLGTIITFFIVALYDTDSKTLKNLLRISAAITFIAIIGLFYFDKIDLVVTTVQERFLGVFSGKASVKQFSSGRGIILSDIYNNHFINSSVFEFLFGHGMGSIEFTVNGALYESSHNIFMDFAYRNGVLFLLLYMFFFLYLLYKFIQFRSKENLALFGIFIFLHFELLVNPYLFAVQMGWIYSFFVAGFLVKLKGKNNKTLESSVV